MNFNFPNRGFGSPPPGWIANSFQNIMNSITQTYQRLVSKKPSTTPRELNFTDQCKVTREITALCEARKVAPTAWVALAVESVEAERAVRASLQKVPVVPNQIR